MARTGRLQIPEDEGLRAGYALIYREDGHVKIVFGNPTYVKIASTNETRQASSHGFMTTTPDSLFSLTGGEPRIHFDIPRLYQTPQLFQRFIGAFVGDLERAIESVNPNLHLISANIPQDRIASFQITASVSAGRGMYSTQQLGEVHVLGSNTGSYPYDGQQVSFPRGSIETVLPSNMPRIEDGHKYLGRFGHRYLNVDEFIQRYLKTLTQVQVVKKS